ncbi:MAG: Gfo/Idh/MocA family oxidoreductase [Planctomycetes bacterium]|nr:Gfo/Idh/MocA family oxidoreductase [Planctomycetota bacterium]
MAKKKSDKLRVGVVGIGFMGSNHFNIWRSRKDAEVVAIADVNPRKLSGDWSEIAGNIDVGGGKVDLKNVRTFTNPGKLIKDPDVDIVDITLPTYLHARFSIMALEAGKHVLCEKPMAISIQDAQKMVKAAQAAARRKQRFMIAHCIRFWPEYAALKTIVEKKTYGKVLSVMMKRLSPTPVWSWQNWLMNSHKSGSAALDLHIHDTDYVLFLFGKPKAVMARGVKGIASTRGYDHIITQYIYAKGPAVAAEGGWIVTPSTPFEMAFHVVCEKATILFSTGRSPMMTIHAGTRIIEPRLPSGGDGYQREIDYFATCVKNNENPKIVTPDDALLSVKTVFAEIESANSGKPVPVK